MDDFLPTIYTVALTDGRDFSELTTLIEQTSYTITGLTLDTVYTITVTAANMCGSGPEFRTVFHFPIMNLALVFHFPIMPLPLLLRLVLLLLLHGSSHSQFSPKLKTCAV